MNSDLVIVPGRMTSQLQFLDVVVKMCIRDRCIHWVMYLQQFEATACVNNWTEKEKAISFVLVLIGPVPDLRQKVPELLC